MLQGNGPIAQEQSGKYCAVFNGAGFLTEKSHGV